MIRLIGTLLLPIVAALLFAAPAVAQNAASFAGRGSAVNGATLEVAGRLVRLFGIDVPSVGEHCRLRSGNTWPCGQNAAFALANIVGRHWVHCRPTREDGTAGDGDNGTRGDGRGATVAVCNLAGADGPEINAAMVRQGWARAGSGTDAYKAHEAAARNERLGLWADNSISR